MKKSFEKLLFPLFLLFALASCEKQETKVTFLGGTAPVLTASQAGTITIAFATKDEDAVKISWTNPNYQFSTGVSSHDVDYLLEMDTVGANFTNPNKKVLAISKDLSKTFTQSEMNDLLLNQLVLKPGIPHQIAFKVTSNIKNGSISTVPLTSNTLQFTVTPYTIPPKVAPPPSGKLYIVGSATPGGWNNPVPEPSQQFTKVSETVYEITIPLTGAGSYLLLPVNGSWDAKYGGMGSNNSNNVNGDDFKPGGGDLLAPAASGKYKIVVDFQRGKFTVNPQ